ncbi:MAG: hypothetical protein P9M06_05530 [Candidatus Saelkia tenebricola]|nr:hypothetical protein [Candidatus Saelkia tenebricola]
MKKYIGLLMIFQFLVSIPVFDSFFIYRRTHSVIDPRLQKVKSLISSYVPSMPNAHMVLIEVRKLMTEIGMDRDGDDLRKETIFFFVDRIKNESYGYKRNICIDALRILFHHLSSDERYAVIAYLDGNEPALGVIVPRLNRIEITAIEQAILSQAALFLAQSIKFSEIEDLGKILVNLKPEIQAQAITEVMHNLVDYEESVIDVLGVFTEIDQRSKEELADTIKNCIISNLENLHPESKDALYDIVNNMLMNTDELIRSVGIEVGNLLIYYLNDSVKQKQLRLTISLVEQ